MPLQRDPVELRVLGALMEKALTTPDYYPLTFAALLNACNQKSSRDPVMALTDAQLREALAALGRDGLVRERSPAGSRVPKYSHRLGDSLGLSFDFDPSQLAVLAVLILRGHQTPGELRGRAERLLDGAAERDVERILHGLRDHPRGPWVRELPREPGRREHRWSHLLGDDDQDAAPSMGSAHDSGAGPDDADRPAPVADASGAARGTTTTGTPTAAATADLEQLAAAVDRLQARLQEVEARLGALEDDLR